MNPLWRDEARSHSAGRARKASRRNQHQAARVVERREQTADEPHVVVQRQPGHSHRRRARRQRTGGLERGHLRHQRRVRERHRLRLPTVEPEENWMSPSASGCTSTSSASSPRDTSSTVRQPSLGRAASTAAPSSSFTFQLGEHQRRACHLEHPRRGAVVLLQPAQPHRRVEGHRHRPANSVPKKASMKPGDGGQEDGHPLPLRDAQPAQPRGGVASAAIHLRPGQPPTRARRHPRR